MLPDISGGDAGSKNWHGHLIHIDGTHLHILLPGKPPVLREKFKLAKGCNIPSWQIGKQRLIDTLSEDISGIIIVDTTHLPTKMYYRKYLIVDTTHLPIKMY